MDIKSKAVLRLLQGLVWWRVTSSHTVISHTVGWVVVSCNHHRLSTLVKEFISLEVTRKLTHSPDLGGELWTVDLQYSSHTLLRRPEPLRHPPPLCLCKSNFTLIICYSEGPRDVYG